MARWSAGAALLTVMLLAAAYVGFGSLTSVCCAQAAPILDRQATSLQELDNGLRLVTKQAPGDYVVAALYVHGGSRTETAWPAGMARFAELLMFQGSTGNQAMERQAEAKARAIFWDSATTRDFTYCRLAMAPQDLAFALDRLAAALSWRDFTATDIERTRREMLRDLTEPGTPGAQPNILSVVRDLDDALWVQAFSEHPYGNPSRGTSDSLDRITGDALRQYLDTFYVPSNTSLVVVGAVTAQEALQAATDTFGKLPRGEAKWDPPKDEPRQTKMRRATRPLPAGARRSVLMMGFHAPGMAAKPKVCATDILYTVLGQGPRARLPRVLVQEKKLATMVDVEFVTRRDTGLFVITCVFAPENELKVREAIRSELAKLTATKFTAAELADTKRLLARAYALSNEALTDQSGSLGFYDSMDTWEFAVDYVDLVNQVSADDVQQVARELFRLDAYTIIIGSAQREGGTREARDTHEMALQT